MRSVSLLAWRGLEDTSTFSQHLSSFTSTLEPGGKWEGVAVTAWLVKREKRNGTREREGKARRDTGVGARRKQIGTRTLAEMPKEHVKEGDVDGLVGSSVIFDLAQHHLQPEYKKGKGKTQRYMDKDLGSNKTPNPSFP